MKTSYQCFEYAIKEAVQAEATKIPCFAEEKKGCIRIVWDPKCQEAYTWAGKIGKFNPGDICTTEGTYPILPGGTYIAENKNSKNIVSTYGVTAMKTGQLFYAQEYKQEEDIMLSGTPIEGLATEKGFSPWRGALCCRITYDKRVPGDTNATPPFGNIVISVSGASQEEDLACAAAAIEVVKTIFAQEQKFCVSSPDINF